MAKLPTAAHDPKEAVNTLDMGFGTWACGSAMTWMGSCLGKASCTITTACGTSSIWLDCW